MQYVTNLGDSSVVLPVALLILIWLFCLAGKRTALLWCCALFVAGGGTAILKIAIDACTAPVTGLNSPSGHTGMSTLVYGGLALVISAETTSWRRVVSSAAGVAIIAAVALSRVVLGAHDIIEVIVGLLIGGAALALFAHGYVGADRRIWPLACTCAALAAALAFFNHSVPLEPLWHRLGAELREATGICWG